MIQVLDIRFTFLGFSNPETLGLAKHGDWRINGEIIHKHDEGIQ